MQYDVIIIGCGVAGLYAALNFPKNKKILLINKRETFKCNSFYAQGGVALAVDEADIASHIQDTLLAGAGLCDEEAVNTLSMASRKVIDEIIELGFKFDTDDNGELLYTKEAAHSRNRILHAGGDATGRYLHLFLLEHNIHPMLSNSRVVDFLIKNHECFGVTVLNHRKTTNIYAKEVIIASGGVGSLYQYHTNAPTISADMQGLALLKGIKLDKMEMMQFHPTVYIGNNSVQKLLLSEALRGEGATIEDEEGNRFLFDYDKRAELASRDIVSRAIYDYKKKTNMKVYLCFSAFSEDFMVKRFPNIYQALHLLGFDVPKQRVPISPAFHYAIGGIKTDLNGKVEGIKSLYAIGEVASTGVHGANRLASNSLLEGLVFAKRAVADILKHDEKKNQIKFNATQEIMSYKDDKEKKNLLRKIMWDYVSIVRTPHGLNLALKEVDNLLHEKIGRLLKFRLLTAKKIISSAIKRQHSLGTHIMVDDED